MRHFNMIVLAAIAAVNITNADAQQWSDAVTWLDTNVRSPYFPSVPPVTNLGILAVGASCGASGFASFTAPGLQPNPNEGFSPTTCDTGGEMYVDLDQFARQSELQGVNSSVDSLSAQIATMNARLTQALHSQTMIAYGGIAQALAMAGTTDIQPDENYAVSINMGTFGGQSAFAGGATARITDHASINAGFTAGTSGGPMGGRVGLRFGW
jgi:autotransporter adhesin